MNRFPPFIINLLIYLQCVLLCCIFHFNSFHFFRYLNTYCNILIVVNGDCIHSFYCTLKRRQRRLVIHIGTIFLFLICINILMIFFIKNGLQSDARREYAYRTNVRYRMSSINMNKKNNKNNN